jgi:hypothetical protein
MQCIKFVSQIVGCIETLWWFVNLLYCYSSYSLRIVLKAFRRHRLTVLEIDAMIVNLTVLGLCVGAS